MPDTTRDPENDAFNLTSHWAHEAVDATSTALIEGAYGALHGDLGETDPVGMREAMAAMFELGRRSTVIGDASGQAQSYPESCLDLINNGSTTSNARRAAL